MKVKAGTGAWTYRMEYPIVQSDEEKISPKCVRRGLIELSTISNGSTCRAFRSISPAINQAVFPKCEDDPEKFTT